MKTMSERFRDWYDHERDCNAKIMTMLHSVPAQKRDAPEFQRALDLLGHMIKARRLWLHRLGGWPEFPGGWEHTGLSIDQMPNLIAATENAWVDYLMKLEDGTIAANLTWLTTDGKQYWRWPAENILYQVSCHAWYHRGQIVELVRILGGKPESTDYIFWNRPEVVTGTSSAGT
jgi:uncharacterized damage-inducible protein DinB